MSESPLHETSTEPAAGPGSVTTIMQSPSGEDIELDLDREKEAEGAEEEDYGPEELTEQTSPPLLQYEAGDGPEEEQPRRGEEVDFEKEIAEVDEGEGGRTWEERVGDGEEEEDAGEERVDDEGEGGRAWEERVGDGEEEDAGEREEEEEKGDEEIEEPEESQVDLELAEEEPEDEEWEPEEEQTEEERPKHVIQVDEIQPEEEEEEVLEEEVEEYEYTKDEVKYMKIAFAAYQIQKTQKKRGLASRKPDAKAIQLTEIPIRALGSVLRSLGLNPTMSSLGRYAKWLNADPIKGVVKFEELLIIVGREKKVIIGESHVLEAFRFIDVENKGLISVETLRDLLVNTCERFTQEEWIVFSHLADLKKTGFVNYDNFVARMGPNPPPPEKKKKRKKKKKGKRGKKGGKKRIMALFERASNSSDDPLMLP